MTRILIEPLIDPKTGGSGKHFVWAFGTWPSGSGFRKHSKSYFTFLTTPEIGLTNNTAATQVNFLISESETPWVHPEGAKLIQTDPIHQSAALKWRKMIAQGKARRRPGFAFPNISQALKGRHNFGLRLALAMRGFCFALTTPCQFLIPEIRSIRPHPLISSSILLLLRLAQRRPTPPTANLRLAQPARCAQALGKHKLDGSRRLLPLMKNAS